MSIVNGPKIINTMVSAANGDTYGDGERHQFRSWQALVQPNVKQMLLNAAPGGPANGDTYVIGASPTGWTPSGQTALANNIAYWAVDNQDGPSISPTINTGAWEFYVAQIGWEVFDNTTGLIWRFNGTTWLPASLRGTATSVSGTTITVAYTNSYSATPTVIVTPTTNAGAYYLSASSASGFTITYATSGAQTFSYVVLGS